ncbi:MAG: prolyl oligopeptidase family serine peptidase [Rikenellaceae bacterium]
MKRELLLCGAVLSLSVAAFAQKRPLDHTVYDGWKSVGSTAVSDDGSVVSYEVVPQEGDGMLHFYLPKAKKNQEIVIERGYRATITPDGKYAVALIKPQFALTRQAKIDKKKSDDMPQDSLAIISFEDGSITKFAKIKSFKIGEDSAPYLAILSSDTSLLERPKGDRGPKSHPEAEGDQPPGAAPRGAGAGGASAGNTLLIYAFGEGVCDTLQSVSQYTFNKSGESMALLTAPTKGKSLVSIYTPSEGEVKQLSNEAMPYNSLPTFDESGSKMLYLSSIDSLSSGSKMCEVYLYTLGEQAPKCIIERGYSKNLQESWGITETASPRFSKNAERIFVGAAPIRMPKDTTLVSFETAGLDIWHYATPEIPPMELVNLNSDMRRTCTTIYDAASGELIPLSTSLEERISLVDDGVAPFAIATDKTPYLLQAQWDTQNPSDVYIVDLESGERTLVAESVVVEQVTASPEYNYLLWYDSADRNWYSYNVASAETTALTASSDVVFWSEIHDTPSYPRSYGMAGWSEGDAAVYLYDCYDIWRVAVDGSSMECITAGEGRTSNRTFRYVNTDASAGPRGGSAKVFEAKEKLLLSVFDNTSKRHGYATTTFAKAAAPSIKVLDGYTFGQLKKAEDAELYLYTKANFETSPNVYITESEWKSDKKLSDINPQQEDYLWGTAELYSWHAYDGTPLEGLLFKPENFDPTKKYPVMIYFYERKSDDLYSYYAPAPSRSTVNLSFYCSRGYVVFVPDIVYSTGTPGESAYNCIVSGAESLTKNEWIDAENMAIQGQSWGGYQTAYLVTRTNMFKAAGSGAPVSNMTSAYGGIRWSSGMSRQFQYEHTQSRIGQTLFEAPELYIANSPLFKADKVETPILIMHNDEDGSVPWYQGIEYFMALRRLGKEAWLLQYNGEDHNLVERRNTKDLSIRLQQFFDHYLKGEPMPAWMKTGIPASRKGEYFGFEY